MRNRKLSRLLSAALTAALLLSLLVVGASPALAAADPGKIDVWDFGAERLDEALYNNMLTADEINSWYPEGTVPGSDGNTIPSFQSGTGLSFSDGGKPNTHRIRTMNEAVTRRDNKDLVGEDGTVYQGYIYSNSGKNPDVYVALELNAGDKVTVIAGSNGKESLITFEGPGGVEDQQNFTNLGGAQTMVFYPREDGTYKFWSATEKLVIARIYRERAKDVAVSGTVAQPAGLTNYKLAFTNTKNGAVIAAEVGDTGYSVVLPAPFSYDVSLLNANGYIVKDAPQLVLDGEAAVQTLDLTVEAVPLTTVTGKIVGLSDAALAKLELTFTADAIYVPEVTVSGDSYTAVVERGMTNHVVIAGVNDYDLTSADQVSYGPDTTADITFAPKPTHKVTVAPTGAALTDLAKAVFTFTNLKEEGYVYTFTGPDAIALRDGVYSVTVTGLEGFAQKLTSNVVVAGADMTKPIGFEKVADPVVLPYKATVTVGAKGCDYTTLNDAMDAVRAMERKDGQRVTISIQPGNYEEMLVVDVPNITLKNASDKPSLELKNKGVDIDNEAVRITHYYGCGYNYYSMGEDCKYHEDLLQVNKENGYESFENPGDGVVNGSYWNSTVVITASGFQAQGIIFENSFNQYVSAKSVNDVIVPNSKCKEDKAAPRAEMKTVGDTTVQHYAYKERAGALSMGDNCTEMYFENCKFISRQDTLYGGDNTVAAFYDCDILGSTDYIYGPMTAVFANCNLMFNTNESSEFDWGYITAPRHTQGRGFLMYNCYVTSTQPGVDTASRQVSKPGYFGRPWQGNTGEAVFYNTVIGAANDGTSLILPEGWFDSLSGKSPLCGEYGTVEATMLDNSAGRAPWAAQFKEPVLADGTPIAISSYLGDWDPFAGKDLTCTMRNYANGTAGTKTVKVDGKSVTLNTYDLDGQTYVWVREAASALNGTAAQFDVTWQDGVTLVARQAYSGGKDFALNATDYRSVPNFVTTLGDGDAQMKAILFTDANGGGYTYYKLSELAKALGFQAD